MGETMIVLMVRATPPLPPGALRNPSAPFLQRSLPNWLKLFRQPALSRALLLGTLLFAITFILNWLALESSTACAASFRSRRMKLRLHDKTFVYLTGLAVLIILALLSTILGNIVANDGHASPGNFSAAIPAKV